MVLVLVDSVVSIFAAAERVLGHARDDVFVRLPADLDLVTDLEGCRGIRELIAEEVIDEVAQEPDTCSVEVRWYVENLDVGKTRPSEAV